VGGFGAVFGSVLAGAFVSVKNELPKDLGLQPDVNDDKYPVPLLSARFPVLFVVSEGELFEMVELRCLVPFGCQLLLADSSTATLD